MYACKYIWKLKYLNPRNDKQIRVCICACICDSIQLLCMSYNIRESMLCVPFKHTHICIFMCLFVSIKYRVNCTRNKFDIWFVCTHARKALGVKYTYIFLYIFTVEFIKVCIKCCSHSHIVLHIIMHTKYTQTCELWTFDAMHKI